MKATINKLEALLKMTKEYVSTASDQDVSHKAHPDKWSKKEIIGHLIDSGINNIQRFTGIRIDDAPYRIHPMKQVELVQVNDYQHAPTEELLDVLISINHRVIHLMKLQTDQSLATPIELYTEGNMSDLRYLMVDYVDHFEGHVKQIVGA